MRRLPKRKSVSSHCCLFPGDRLGGIAMNDRVVVYVPNEEKARGKSEIGE